MPNQRAKNKIYLGGFLEKELHRQIVRLAKQEGMAHNKFGFAVQLMQESIQRRQKKVARATKPKAAAKKTVRVKASKG